MKLFLSILFRKDIYASIPYDDLMSRQRFILFRILTFTAAFASLSAAAQEILTSEKSSLPTILFAVLGLLILVNFYIVKDLHKLPVAYAFTLLAGFLILHIQGYSTGGIRNTGTMYLCGAIMSAFMLLGSRAGIWYTALVLVNVVFFYFATEYTNWITYNLFENDIHIIYQDALVTFLVALFIVAAQSNYLHSGKNVIIERITEQKDQLELSNRKLKEYTEDLERTNRELDKFASIVSHDLKAPLRAIGNLTGWIEEDAGDSLTKEVRTNFDMIKQRVKRMEDLINAILDYSRADRRVGDQEQINTRQLIEETVDFVGKPENASIEIGPGMPSMNSDKTRLTQVFSNLIVNAINYNDKPQIKINITVHENDEGWVFSVKDNGPGIEKQYHEKIFVIFQTLNRRDDVESTGVGLAIVKKIIEDQGGKIWVESELGNGADFRFLWPKVRKEKDSALIAAVILV